MAGNFREETIDRISFDIFLMDYRILNIGLDNLTLSCLRDFYNTYKECRSI